MDSIPLADRLVFLQRRVGVTLLHGCAVRPVFERTLEALDGLQVRMIGEMLPREASLCGESVGVLLNRSRRSAWQVLVGLGLQGLWSYQFLSRVFRFTGRAVRSSLHGFLLCDLSYGVACCALMRRVAISSSP